MNLNEKIIKAIIPDWNADMPTPNFVEKIRQAFVDEGYVQTVRMGGRTVTMNGKDPLGWILYYPNEAMTGQEWYKRFKNEQAKAPAMLRAEDDFLALAIAKRASGIDK